MLHYPTVDTIIPHHQRERVIVKGRWKGEARRWIGSCTVVLMDSGEEMVCTPAEIAPDLDWTPPDAPRNNVLPFRPRAVR